MSKVLNTELPPDLKMCTVIYKEREYITDFRTLVDDWCNGNLLFHREINADGYRQVILFADEIHDNIRILSGHKYLYTVSGTKIFIYNTDENTTENTTENSDTTYTDITEDRPNNERILIDYLDSVSSIVN